METKNLFRIVYGFILVSLIYLTATSCTEENKVSDEKAMRQRVKWLEERVESLENDILENEILIYELSENDISQDTTYNPETYFYE